MQISNELFKRSEKVAPGGVHSPVRAFKSVGGAPVFLSHAEGATAKSVDGKTYIDFCQSFGPNILGHRDPDVFAAVQSTLNDAWVLGACDPYSLNLSEWLVNELPWIEKLRFVCSGTEAVMSALRLARGVTGRDKVLKFKGCYHGHVDSMLVKAGSGLACGETASDSAGVSEKVASETLIAPLNDIQVVEEIFDRRGTEIAALIIEPLPANFGLLEQKKGYLQAICEIARKSGALVIFDEVISGFRVKLGGMAEETGIEPDLVTYGKIMGGGFPVGCYAGKAEYLDQMAPSGPVYQAGTLAANPLGMVAGLETLKKVKRLDLYDELENRTLAFAKTINTACEKNRWGFKVATKSSLFWLHYNPEGRTFRSTVDFSSEMDQKFARVFSACLKNGVYLGPSAFECGFVSWAHSDLILEESAQFIINSIEEAHRDQ